MKCEVKKVGNIRRELRFHVQKERVSKKLDEVYKEIAKSAKIKGFRQGKAPRHVLEASHGQMAHQETIQKLIPEVYQEGIEQQQLNPIDMPEIEDVEFKDGQITFTAKLEIKPEVKIKDYKGIKVARKSSEVTDEDINKTLDYFKQGQGKDSKEVVLDDAFAKGLGYPTFEEFKKTLKRQLEMDKDNQSKADLENQIVEALLKKTKVQAPESLVAKQLKRRVEDMLNRFKAQGLAGEELKKKEESLQKDLKEAVEKDVQVYLIFDKIAELEGIHVHQGENMPAKVMELLLKEANYS